MAIQHTHVSKKYGSFENAYSLITNYSYNKVDYTLTFRVVTFLDRATREEFEKRRLAYLPLLKERQRIERELNAAFPTVHDDEATYKRKEEAAEDLALAFKVAVRRQTAAGQHWGEIEPCSTADCNLDRDRIEDVLTDGEVDIKKLYAIAAEFVPEFKGGEAV